jgi:hypothetical protein
VQDGGARSGGVHEGQPGDVGMDLLMTVQNRPRKNTAPAAIGAHGDDPSPRQRSVLPRSPVIPSALGSWLNPGVLNADRWDAGTACGQLA